MRLEEVVHEMYNALLRSIWIPFFSRISFGVRLLSTANGSVPMAHKLVVKHVYTLA